MLSIFLVVFQLILSLSILFLSIGIIVYTIDSSRADAPFVPVRKRALERIIQALKLKSGSVVYDLGCGDARVLIESINNTKDIRAIGVEKNFIIYLWTKWCTRNIPIKIRWGDVTNVPLKDATHIYMYLFPKIMDKLLPKFQKECAIGTRIISCDFVFSKLSPDEVIELPVVKDPLCKKLYVYVLK